jgi:hypothetical protein
MLTTTITWPPFYIHYVFFPFFQFNSRKIVLYCLMLKATDFSWFWVFWVSFACWFFVFLSCCYFFFFFYSCTATTTWITTTITSNNVSEGKGTSETSYKLWSFEFWSLGGRKEQATPKLVLLPTLGLGSMHTHTQVLITVQDLHQVMQPHIHLFSLYMGFEVSIWVVHSCVFLNL